MKQPNVKQIVKSQYKQPFALIILAFINYTSKFAINGSVFCFRIPFMFSFTYPHILPLFDCKQKSCSKNQKRLISHFINRLEIITCMTSWYSLCCNSRDRVGYQLVLKPFSPIRGALFLSLKLKSASIYLTAI